MNAANLTDEHIVQTPLPVTPRTCGTCTVCCSALAVKELHKPYYTPCKHQCNKGCTIYNTKPTSCTGFECIWLAIDKLPENTRPDRLGAIFSLEEDKHGLWLSVFYAKPLNQEELKTKIEPLMLSLAKKAKCRGIRIYPHNAIVGTAFAINNDYQDHGESEQPRDFTSDDDYIYTLESITNRKAQQCLDQIPISDNKPKTYQQPQSPETNSSK